MDGFLEHQLICRTCLRVIEIGTQGYGYIEDVNGNLKDMLMCCVPELDIYVSSHPIICFPCIQLLVTVYNFKTRCLNTETIIRSYIQRNNLMDYNHVNLSCVVQELIRMNNYYRDLQQRSALEVERCNFSKMQENHAVQQNISPLHLNAEQPVKQPNVNSNDPQLNQGHIPQENIKVPNENKEPEEKPLENRMRFIIKIDKNKISIPYDKNEDSSEKENAEQDVEMNENPSPPTESSPPLYPPPDNLKRQVYECDNCTFVTTHLNYHIAHRQVCVSDLEKQEKKCPHCPHVTNRQYALNKHINTMHTKAIWYTCEHCNYRSTDSSCVRRHKRNMHPDIIGSESTVCKLCNHKCSNEFNLRKHMVKHDDNLILQCQFCSYSTRDRSNFRKHVFIHSPKPKDCDFCAYKCVSPYQMKLHLKKYHNGVGMEDIDCRSDCSITEVVNDISAAINEAKNYVGHEIN